MKLHLGCGIRYIDGWVNIDWSDKYKVDYSIDLGTTPLPCEDGQADRVISSHLIEHLNRWEGMFHLKEIYRTMKPGAKFTLAFPCLRRIIDCYEGRDRSVNVVKNDDWLIEAIFETQKDETIIHKYGYTTGTMTRLLIETGFKDVTEIREPVVIDGKTICDFRYAITILEATK